MGHKRLTTADLDVSVKNEI